MRTQKPCGRCGGEKPKGSKYLCDNCPPLSSAEGSKRYRERDPDRAAANAKAWRLRHPEKVRAAQREWHHRNPEDKLYRLAKRRAKQAGLEFSISRAEISIPEYCPALGLLLQKSDSSTGFNDSSPTLDRIDNRRGYVSGNVQVISWRANRIKCDASLDELKSLVAYMENLINQAVK